MKLGVEAFFIFITQFGGFLIVSLVCLAVIRFLWRKSSGLIKYFISVIVGTEALVYLLKRVIDKPRPFGAVIYGEHGGSMPSGHATISILLYGYICYLIFKFYPKARWRNALIALLTLLALLIGYSRLYLNVHYLSDVLAGFLLGGTALFYLVRISERKQRK